MAKKLIALLAVLALVITPLFVIGEDAQADPNPPSNYITLDDISSGTYWVKGTLNTTTGTMTLSNTGKAVTEESETLLLDTTGSEITRVDVAEGFTVPADATITTSDGSSATTLELNVEKNMTVNGTLVCNVLIGNVTLSLDGGVLAGYSRQTGISYTIKTAPGSTIVGTNKAIFSEVVIDPSDASSLCAFTIDNIFCDGFTLKNNSTTSNGTKYTLSGTLFGLDTEGWSILDLNDENASYEFNNAYFSRMIMNVDDAKEILIVDNRQVVNYVADNLILAVGDAPAGLLNSIKSPNGFKQIVLSITVDDVHDPDVEITTQLLFATIDETGMVPYFDINCLATKGIKSIGEENVINFVKAGETFNLNNIKVTCESGYHFVGWYYMNDAGVMVKIVNPDKFVALDNMTIYAMAEADAPAGHDYTGFFIGLIVLLVLIVLAAFIGIYLKATERSVQKTAAKKSSKR